MKSRDFVFWLQGFFEVSKAETLTAEQVSAVKNHLNLVFKHEIDPPMGAPVQQAELSDLHMPGAPGGVLYRC